MASIIFQPWPLPSIFFLLFISSLFTLSSSFPSSYLHQRHLLQSNSPQNIEIFFPSGATTAFKSPNSPPPSPSNQLSEAPSSPTPAKIPVKSQPPTKSNGSFSVTKAVVATAASTLVIAGLFFFLLHRYALSRRRVQSDKRHKASLHSRQDETGVSHDAFKLLNGNLKGLIVDENGLDVLYWRKLEGGGDARRGFRKEVLGRGVEERRVPGKAALHLNSSSNSSSRVLPESRYAIRISSSPGPSSKYSNSSIKIASESRDTNCVFSHLSAESSNSLCRIQQESKDPNHGFSHPSSKYSNYLSRIQQETRDSNRIISPTGTVTATDVMNMARPIIQVPNPPPPASSVNKSSALPPPPPIAIKKKPVPPPPPPRAGGLKPRPAFKEKPNSIEILEPKESSAGQTKLKPLHWDKVVADPNHSMVWDKIGSGSFRFDGDLMEALFGYVATNRKSAAVSKNLENTSKSNLNQPTQTCLLDSRRSQNIAIVLRSLALSRQEILNALLNGNGLNTDTLEKLTKIAPTKEEETMILEFTGNLSKLADAESFLYHLLQAVPSPFLRLDAMLFRSTFDYEIFHLRESLKTLEFACKELRTRGPFLKLLEAILKAGNRMNAGTARGNAQAFNLTALRKLSDVKSTDGKTTLLHFVVEEVVRSEGKRCVINRNQSLGISNSNSSPNTIRKEGREKKYIMHGLPVVGGLSIEFSNVKKAATIDYDDFVNACAALTARMNGIRRFLGDRHLGAGDGFVREMKGFLEAAGEKLKVVKEEEARVMELVKRTTEYYQAGASKDKLQLFIIVKDFLGMVDRVCVDIAHSQQQKKPAAGDVGGSSPPPAPVKRVPVRFPNLPAHFMSNSSKTSSSFSTSDFEDGF